MGGVLLALGFMSAVVVWHLAFRPPSIDLMPLPASLVSLDQAPGRSLLRESRFTADHADLAAAFEPQMRRAYCGVASSVVVLNAMRKANPRLTQSSFFTDAATEVRSALRVTFAGMTLAELAGLLRAHGAEVTLYHADEVPIDTFRAMARSNLETPGDFVIVNYQRATLGQGEMGHISPLAAYNQQTDRFLVLDVASHKFPRTWVKTEDLWHAMNTLDATSGRTRGFVVVREGAAGQHSPSRTHP